MKFTHKIKGDADKVLFWKLGIDHVGSVDVSVTDDKGKIWSVLVISTTGKLSRARGITDAGLPTDTEGRIWLDD